MRRADVLDELRQPGWTDYPGGLDGDAYAVALLEFDFRLAEACEQIARAQIAAAGHDPDSPIVWAEMVEGIARGVDDRRTAKCCEAERVYRYSARRLGWGEASLGHVSRREREAWRVVFGQSRPQQHGARHRRASGRKPVRRRGSRRPSAPTRGDPDDGDPEPVGARPRACWQTAGAPS